MKEIRDRGPASTRFHTIIPIATDPSLSLYRMFIDKGLIRRHCQRKKRMTNIKEDVDQYVPPVRQTVADLDKVPVDAEVVDCTDKDKQGEEYTFKAIVINDQKYRLPDSVRADLKVIMKERPDMTHFKVKKQGSGLNTTYTTIPM